jgi:hypothetical protein
MKKVLAIAAGLLLVASTASAVNVEEKVQRSSGMELDEGFVWSIGGIAPPFPACGAGITVRGAVYLGAIDVGGFPSGEDNDALKDMGGYGVWDAQELLDAAETGKFVLHLDNALNAGFAQAAEVSVVPDAIVRNHLQGNAADGSGPPLPRGPFPAGFNRIHNYETMANAGSKVGGTLFFPFVPVVSSPSTVLSSGPTSILNACVGPTGQVRVIDPDNNAGWAEECVAGGWRAESIQLGGGNAFNDALVAALDNPSITTCRFSCSPVALGRNHACDIVIDNPIALSINVVNGSYASDMGEEFLWTTGTFGGSNYVSIDGADESPIANMYIEAL